MLDFKLLTITNLVSSNATMVITLESTQCVTIEVRTHRRRFIGCIATVVSAYFQKYGQNQLNAVFLNEYELPFSKHNC